MLNKFAFDSAFHFLVQVLHHVRMFLSWNSNLTISQTFREMEHHLFPSPSALIKHSFWTIFFGSLDFSTWGMSSWYGSEWAHALLRPTQLRLQGATPWPQILNLGGVSWTFRLLYNSWWLWEREVGPCELEIMFLAATSFSFYFNPQGHGLLLLFFYFYEILESWGFIAKRIILCGLEGKSLWVIQTLSYPNTKTEGPLNKLGPMWQSFWHRVDICSVHCPCIYQASPIVILPVSLALLSYLHGCACHARVSRCLCSGACVCMGSCGKRRVSGCLLSL